MPYCRYRGHGPSTFRVALDTGYMLYVRTFVLYSVQAQLGICYPMDSVHIVAVTTCRSCYGPQVVGDAIIPHLGIDNN